MNCICLLPGYFKALNKVRLLIACLLLVTILPGCSVTRKTTIETGGDQEVQRTSYSFEFHGLTGGDGSDDD